MKEYAGVRSWQDQAEATGAFSSSRKEAEEQRRIEVLENEITGVLQSKNVQILAHAARVKTSASIMRKIENFNIPELPLLDIYRLEMVVQRSDIVSAIKALRRKYPMAKRTPWGEKTLRNSKNPNSHPDYNTVRMNLVFGEGKVAELKLLTPEQVEMERRTRSTYEENRQLKK